MHTNQTDFNLTGYSLGAILCLLADKDLPNGEVLAATAELENGRVAVRFRAVTGRGRTDHTEFMGSEAADDLVIPAAYWIGGAHDTPTITLAGTVEDALAMADAEKAANSRGGIIGLPPRKRVAKPVAEAVTKPVARPRG